MALEITPLPDPPSRADPANFAPRADAFLGALPLFTTETNALAASVEIDAAEAAQSVVDAAAQVALAAGQVSLATEQAMIATEAKDVAVGITNYKGEYNPATTYLLGESVSYLGERFVSKKTNTGITPVNGNDWLLIPEVKATINEISLLEDFNFTVEFVESIFSTSGNFTVPVGISKLKFYAVGAGGSSPINSYGGGGGGGFAFGEIAVVGGEVLNITAGINSSASIVRQSNSLQICNANQGANGGATAGGAGGTASIAGIVLNGAAYSGGVGGTGNNITPQSGGGGGSSGSPLGNGFAGGNAENAAGQVGYGGGGGGIGGVGANATDNPGGGGGAGSAGGLINVIKGGDPSISGPRLIPFSDYFLKKHIDDFGYGGKILNESGGEGGGGAGGNPVQGAVYCGHGGFGGGGGGNLFNTGAGTSVLAGNGGVLGGGGGGSNAANRAAGTSLAGGGAGGSAVALNGGPAVVWLYY